MAHGPSYEHVVYYDTDRDGSYDVAITTLRSGDGYVEQARHELPAPTNPDALKSMRPDGCSTRLIAEKQIFGETVNTRAHCYTSTLEDAR